MPSLARPARSSPQLRRSAWRSSSRKFRRKTTKRKPNFAAENTVSEEEKAEKEARDAEEARLKAEREHFDFKTVHKFKEDLGQYGDLYVNDALMASLL